MWKIQGGSLLFVVCLLAFTGSSGATDSTKPTHYSMPFNRSSFPVGFLFGAGSSAYQYEGAAYVDGKGLSTWDVFVKEHPAFVITGKILDGSTGNVAEDFYHRYKEDIHLMKKIGLDSFRFSISWPRILPKGKSSGGVNWLGVRFYNNLIDELLSEGIIPFVTLFHWDVPQELVNEYGGVLSPKFVEDYKNYADFCFKTFGDRVKHWVTFNEPYIFIIFGYNDGTLAPGRCSSYAGNCTAGNSATEPYVVGHNLLLAHATTVKLYRLKYRNYQKGEIGITLNSNWYIPKSPESESDVKAANRALEFVLGWFANPVVNGDYPEVMKSLVGKRLPKFSEEQSKLLKGSLDFMGVNYYTANYASDNPGFVYQNQSFHTDTQFTLSTSKAGIPIGEPSGSSWLFVYPRGIYDLTLYIKNRYKVPMYITENGVSELNKHSQTVTKEVLQDGQRIKYLHYHLEYLLKAIKKGATVKGYYAWTLLDDFEWNSGYTIRFGMIYVDFKNNLKRYLKYSAYWLKMFLLH